MTFKNLLQCHFIVLTRGLREHIPLPGPKNSGSRAELRSIPKLNQFYATLRPSYCENMMQIHKEVFLVI